MAVTILVLFLSPILLLVLPTFVTNSVHMLEDTWFSNVFGISYLYYLLGFILLGMSSLIVFLLDISKLSLIFGTVLLIVSGVVFYLTAQIHYTIGGNSITYRENLLTESKNYSWDELDTVTYTQIPASEGFSQYHFNFKDGNTLTFSDSGLIQDYRGLIDQKLRIESIPVERRYRSKQ